MLRNCRSAEDRIRVITLSDLLDLLIVLHGSSTAETDLRDDSFLKLLRWHLGKLLW